MAWATGVRGKGEECDGAERKREGLKWMKCMLFCKVKFGLGFVVCLPNVANG